MANEPIALGGVIPILRVRNLEASYRYYVDKLGFHVNWVFPEDGNSFSAEIARGRTTLFLSVGDQGHFGTWVWIDGKNVDALHEEFKAAGAKIRNPPTNYPHVRDMQVEDPDGNILRFGSDPLPGEPDGPWLDMEGIRWLRQPDGTYKKLAP